MPVEVRSLESPLAGVTGSCEPFDMVLGIELGFSSRTQALYLYVVSLAQVEHPPPPPPHTYFRVVSFPFTSLLCLSHFLWFLTFLLV